MDFDFGSRAKELLDYMVYANRAERDTYKNCDRNCQELCDHPSCKFAGKVSATIINDQLKYKALCNRLTF